MTTIRVDPTLAAHLRTHHISLTDREGKTLGLIMVDANGNPDPNFRRNPVDRTSFKTASGSMTYSDFDYPYTPIAQDSWSGGRGNLDFERDTTRFLDSYRLRTSRPNKIFLGPQEQYTSGYRGLDQTTPGNVTFKALQGSTRRMAKKFPAAASYTAVNTWLLLKRIGEPAVLTVRVLNDNANTPGTTRDSFTLANTVLDDVFSEWLIEQLSTALTSGTNYWIEVEASTADNSENYWLIGTSNVTGTTRAWNGATWDSVAFDLYFRLTVADTQKSCISFIYAEQLYAVLSGTSGAPKLYMNGDRGVADSNAGNPNKLIDATKNWSLDQFVGAVCVVIAGAGRTEERPYRVIEANDATTLDFTSDPFTVQHDTTTEYVIVASNVWQEIGAGGYGGTHGLTVPVTDVLVSTTGVIYFCQGDAVAMRRHREYNNAGTWTSSDWAADGTNMATFLEYTPQAGYIWKANNLDATGSVSVDYETAIPAWATDITFTGTVKKIGSKYDRITGLDIYFDDVGNEALWVGKETRPWIVPSTGNPYPISLKEMENVRSLKNCKAMLAHNVYIYFSLLDGLEQYYDGNLTDMGPNKDEGLPENRQGPIVSMVGYPGNFMVAIDAGAEGYSSVLMRDGSGWHEHYRAPFGLQIKSIFTQTIPGDTIDRLWIYQGNDLIWLPFPGEDLNELQNSNYRYTHEGAIEISRMHSGMMDTLKLVKLLKLMTDSLSDGEQWIEADYRVDSETEWSPFPEEFTESPVQAVNLAEASQDKVTFGAAGKRLMLRLRFYTTNASLTPALNALVLEVVSRISVKRLYALPCRIADNDKDLRGQPEELDADEKFALLEEWTNDAAKSMLLMKALDPRYNNRLVFLQPYDDRVQTLAQTPEERLYQKAAWLVTLMAQDA